MFSLTKMKKTLLLFIIAVLSLSVAPSQDINVTSYEVDLKKEKVKLVWKNPKNQIYSSLGNVLKSNPSYTLIMNAGMYTTTQAPLGLYIENGKTLKQINKKQTAYGNFYMQPNGVFYIEKGTPKVIQTKDFKQTQKIEFATQSGPMLLINGKYHPKFMKGSTNLNIRNGVGILPNGNPIFAISKGPINFYDFATFFKEKGCVNALYLDGAVSRAYIPSEGLNNKGGKFGVMVTAGPISK